MSDTPPITVEKKRPARRVYIALPTYSNSMRRDFVQSLIELLLSRESMFPDVEFVFGTIGGDGVARARNNLAQHFLLATDCTDILFIDVDIVWTPEHVRRLIDSGKDICGARYPIKGMKHRWVLTELPGEKADPVTGKQRVQECGTGMKIIKRRVFEAMMNAFPAIQYFCDAGTSGAVKWDFFSMGVVDFRYLSEDYYFDYRARKIGFDVFVDTKCEVRHQGHIDFPIPANAEIFDGVTLNDVFEEAAKRGNAELRDVDGIRSLVA